MWLAGYWRPRRPGRSTSSREPAWIGSRPRSRLPRSAAATLRCCCSRPQGSSSRSTYASRATRISMRGAQRCSPAGWRAPGAACSTSLAPWRPRPRRNRRFPAICCWTASRCSSPKGAAPAAPVLRRAVAAFASTEVSVEEMLRGAWLATRAANLLWDYDSCLEIGTRALRLARDSGALAVLAAAGNGCGQAYAVGGDSASCCAVGGGARCRQGGDRQPHRPVRRDRARGHPRPGGRGLRADRRARSRKPPPAAKGPPSSTRTGRTACS